jgi:hypothetical protein
MKEDKMIEACSMHGRNETCVQNIYGKYEDRRPLGRSRRRWEDNIEMDLRKIG